MGAIPTPVEFSELTTALLTGMVVGQENPLSNIYTSRIYEVQSHIAMTNHMHSCLAVFIHEGLWQKIQAPDRETIRKAIAEASIMTARHIVKTDEQIVAELLKYGIVFTDEQNGLQIETIKHSVLDRIRKDFPEWVEYIEEIQKIQ
jgi:TRAP-type C4-dicarboxylate transport system substrate-binding protein